MTLGAPLWAFGANSAYANYWIADPCSCHQQEQQAVDEEFIKPPPSPDNFVYHRYRPPMRPQATVVQRPQRPKLMVVKYEAPATGEKCSLLVYVQTEGESTVFVKSSIFKRGLSEGLVVTKDSVVHFPVPCELANASDGALCLNQDYSRVFEPEWFAFARDNLARGEHVLNAGHPLWLKHTR
ncbi:MAG TPA: hypothetical protein VMR46_03410 [Candidatus Paceibacterota bacterium]|nr:hypothetical protein [Candidatus Paceibacterota bacterium]